MKGSISILLLAISLLLSFLFLKQSQVVDALIEILKIKKSYSNEQAKHYESLKNELTLLESAKNPEFLTCKNAELLCSLNSQVQVTEPMQINYSLATSKIIFDYNYYFKEFTDCSNTVEADGEFSYQKSIIANTTCVSPTLTDDLLSFKENLDFSNLEFFNKDITLSSLGKFTAGKVLASEKLLVFALGDIEIGTIETYSELSVTLVSLTGYIKVQNLIGPVKLSTFSKSGGVIPSVLAPSKVVPKTLDSYVLSLKYQTS